MKFRSAFAVLSMTVALTACGELPFQKGAEPAAQGHVGPPGVSPLEQPIETGAALAPVSTAEASTVATAMFRAAGAGWTVTAADKNAVYERPGAKSVGVSVRRMTYARGVEFIGTMNGSVFSLNIQAAACESGDVKTPFTARLRVGSQRLTGCAQATDTMPKAQTRASSAPPKPKSQPKPAPAKPATPAAAAPDAAPATAPVPASTTTPATTAPVYPAAPPPSSTTPATPAMPSTSTPAPASGNAVPAPELILPPTPPAPAANTGANTGAETAAPSQ